MTQTHLIISAWILLSACVGYLAQTKGRSAVLYFIAALLFSPIIVGVYALLMSPTPIPDPVTGPACGKCGKRLSPYWKDRCGWCKAAFSDYPPVE